MDGVAGMSRHPWERRSTDSGPDTPRTHRREDAVVERGFDAWTRRRFGVATAGLTALAALGAWDDGGARKRKQKHKVKHTGGKRPLCKRRIS